MSHQPGPGEEGLFDPAAVARHVREALPSSAPLLPAQTSSRSVPQGAVPQGATKDGLLPDSLTDRGQAKLFVRLYGRDYRHVPGLGWYRWSEYRWKPDENDTVLWAAGEMAESLSDRDTGGRFPEATLRRHRNRALSTSGIKAMLMQAKAAPGMVLKAEELDADPYALCTPQGVIDLYTGQLRPPDPEKDLHSRATSMPARRMETPVWLEYLNTTFGTDRAGQQMISYLQELLGYSITGDVGAQIMPFLYGTGKNGKTVLLDVTLKLLGDYADAAPPGFLMARPFEGHPTDLADLHGRRIYVCSELKPGDRFDEARFKLLTGGDRIKARRMRQDFFSFTPSHKLWLLGNHRPEVGTGGYAFWRRMRLIPFERTVDDARRVNNFAEVLVREEGPGILHWLVEGARRYLNGSRDLAGPDRVRIATKSYAETEDHTGRFITECCTLGDGLRAEQALLYSCYRDWCQAEGATAVSNRAFAARIRETLGMDSPKGMILSNQRKFYPGIGLRAEVGDEKR